MKLEVDLSPTIEQQLSDVASRVWAETMQREAEKRFFPEWMDLETTCEAERTIGLQAFKNQFKSMEQTITNIEQADLNNWQESLKIAE